MTYEQQLNMILTFLYNETKCCATSSTYHIPYEKIKNAYGMWVGTKNIQMDLREEFGKNHLDRFQALDFDDIKLEVIVMIWESNNKMNRYTINECNEFCDNALVMPPIEDFESGKINEVEWYKNHMIHITVGNHDIALEYNADNVTEIDSALKEMYEMEMDFKGMDKDEDESSHNRPAELKDIIHIAVQKDWDHFGYKIGGFAEFIQGFIKKEWNVETVMWYYNVIHKDIANYNNLCKCNFNKVDMSKICNVNSALIKQTIDELICTDRELLHGITEDNKDSDITFVMDHTLKLSGEVIGFFYGDVDEEYIDDLIGDYKRQLFGEED